MFGSIKNDLNSQWSRPNSGLQRLIIINVAVFIFLNIMELVIPEENFLYFLKFFAMPTDLPTLLTRPWTFITSFFTHTGFSHILWNMLYLYWFGAIVREFLGSDRLISLYILGGIVGSISVILLFNVVPMFAERSGGIALGASAGVFAVSVGAATLYPNYVMHLLFFGPVKIKYFVGVFVLLAIFGLKGDNVGGEVAHLGGAFIGYFYIRSLQKGNDIGAWVSSTLTFLRSFFVKTPKMTVHSKPKRETSYTSTTSAPQPRKSAPSQAEIDAILDKISQKGYDSLSREEKEKLFNASKK